MEGGLVVLEGKEDVYPGGDYDQSRLFWQCSASPLNTALGTIPAASSSKASAAGSWQSSFSPLLVAMARELRSRAGRG